MEQLNLKEEKMVFNLESNVFFTGLTSFLTDTSVKMIYAVMPLFLLSIGATKTELSLIEGVAESTASVLKAVSGWLSDKFGKNKPFMIIGYGITAIIAPLYSIAVSPFQILYLRFIERVGKGIRTAPRDSLIAGSTIGKKTGRNFGFHKAMDNSGAIIGPFLAYLLISAFPGNYRRIFLLSGIPAFLGVLSIIFFVKEAKKNSDDIAKKIRLKDFNTRYYIFLIIAVIFTLGNSTDTLLLVKAKDIGFSDNATIFLFLIFNAVSVMFAVPLGIISDKLGREKLIIFGYLLYAALYFGFGKTSIKSVLVMLFALYGIYSAATDGIQKALVSDLIDKNRRGTGLGIYNALIGITLLPASLIAGLLYDKIDNSAPFYFGGALALLAAVMMTVFYRKNIRIKADR